MHREYGGSSAEASGDRSSYGRHACYGHDRCMVLAFNSWQRRVVPAVGSQNQRTKEAKGSEIQHLPFGNDGTGRHSIGGHPASGYVGRGTTRGQGCPLD